MKPKFYPTPTFRPIHLIATFRRIAILAMLAIPMLLGTAFAQTVQLQYDFEDSGTTTTNSGPLAVPLTMFPASGGAVDLHGASGSGIQNTGQSLNISTNPTAGNLAGAFAMAQNNAT